MSKWKKTLQELSVRRKMIKAFKAGHFYLGDIERPIFPKIHAVSVGENTTITFTIPNGLDPKTITKNDYIFKQIFGKKIELEGEVKKFVLSIYSKGIPKNLTYQAKTITPLLAPHRLGIICGKDKNGEWITYDLATKPHILIAGETGSGKSTQLRSILTSLILTKKPSELEIYLGDCKKSEFHIFRKVEHVKCVYSSARDIGKMLSNIKKELDERSNLTELFEVSHVDDLPPEHRRPYILVCIDEFVMLRKDETIMDILTEIVAIGRTLGVFAILSMQRPNAKVLDTTIRANLTTSMGFQLRDAMESKIVNTPDAHKIDIAGRFIMNSDKLYEIQAPYLEMEDAKKLLNPFIVMKSPVKDITEAPKKLTEEDVFNDIKRT
ncbi:FtsK/SpoIIIE domain-containing protein [Robertmurraya korlensis]|uniref:FtsK/SpoIIIE domain-containing protein n=1 Tax=Robertmurraya korlensis TaxID=519977 RepID=UPI00203E33F3|nr:FtsK/SpoIIIE domain-containing protein [Robertmurraya korlensis]MCM3599416.1 FtsK/SpoIIIE domain-containing protein [Robertmurraya korlensis]